MGAGQGDIRVIALTRILGVGRRRESAAHFFCAREFGRANGFGAAQRPGRPADRWDIPRTDWPKAVGELHFRGESAKVTNRRIWGAGQTIYKRSSTLACFMPEEAVNEGLSLILRESPHMAILRAEQLHTHQST